MDEFKAGTIHKKVRKIIDNAIEQAKPEEKLYLKKADDENFSTIFSQFDNNREKCEQVANLFKDDACRTEYIREIYFKILQKTFDPLFAVANTDGMTFEYIDSFDQEIKESLENNSLPNLYNSSEKGLYQFLKTTYIFEQYKHLPDVTIKQGDIFIDCGACFGDVSLWACKNGAKKAYAFEPEHENFELLQKNIEKFVPEGNIDAINLAFGDKKGILKFSSNISSSRFSEDGDISVNVTTLDEWWQEKKREKEFPDFIKMDIEGAEPLALEGSRQIITNGKPRLAISIYHNFSDLWEIPLMIHEMCPTYTFFCKKHHPIHECILYAVNLK